MSGALSRERDRIYFVRAGIEWYFMILSSACCVSHDSFISISEGQCCVESDPICCGQSYSSLGGGNNCLSGSKWAGSFVGFELFVNTLAALDISPCWWKYSALRTMWAVDNSCWGLMCLFSTSNSLIDCFDSTILPIFPVGTSLRAWSRNSVSYDGSDSVGIWKTAIVSPRKLGAPFTESLLDIGGPLWESGWGI